MALRKQSKIMCLKDEISREGEHFKPSEQYVLRFGCIRNYK